jgi:hypothetical protein
MIIPFGVKIIHTGEKFGKMINTRVSHGGGIFINNIEILQDKLQNINCSIIKNKNKQIDFTNLIYYNQGKRNENGRVYFSVSLGLFGILSR